MGQTSGLRTAGPERDLNLDLLDIGAVFYQLNYQGYWELAIMWMEINIPMLVFLFFILVQTFSFGFVLKTVPANRDVW